MKEERLAVLRLLENGVITVDDAERLLLTLRPVPPAPNYYDKMSSAGENMAKFAKKAGKKVGKATESAAKKAEPVIKKAAEKIGEKTEEVCSTAKNYVDKKKAEREKNFVPDVDGEDVSDAPENTSGEAPAEEAAENACGEAPAEDEYCGKEEENVSEEAAPAEEASADEAPAGEAPEEEKGNE